MAVAPRVCEMVFVVETVFVVGFSMHEHAVDTKAEALACKSERRVGRAVAVENALTAGTAARF